MGGHALDSIGYPVCTEGRANCMLKALNFGMLRRADVKKAALLVIVDRPSLRGRDLVYDVFVSIGTLSDAIAEYL